MLKLTALLVVVAAAALAVSASAGTTRKWQQITTTGTQSPVAEIGHARRDGMLHVVWGRRSGPNAYDLVHTQITSSGKVGASQSVVAGWAGIGGVALVVGQNTGLWAYFSGIRSTAPDEPFFGLNYAYSGGGPWTLDYQGSIYRDQFAYGRTPGAAALRPENLAIAAWDGRDGVGVLTPSRSFVTGYGPSPGSCCHHGVNIVSAGQRTMLVWCSMNEAPNGIWAQEVNWQNGAPIGPAMRMPRSTDGQGRRICDVGQRVPVVARAGGGFFIAAKDGAEKAILVWRIGTSRSDRITAGPSFRRVGLASTPDGRVWVGWSRFLNASRLYFRRSNRSGTVFGATVQRAGPGGVVEVQVIDLSAQNDRLDVLGTYSSVTGTNLFHTQALPGLSVSAIGGRTLRFRVTDAGAPVAGATVAVGGRKLVTDRAGRASADLPAGRFTATASKVNYVSATARVQSR
jgi:hypothetical protein